MSEFQNIDEILASATDTLRFARMGLDDFLHSNPDDRGWIGLRNVVIFGRTVTFILQNIRHFQRDAFNAWYAPYEAEMREKPGFKYLYELRTQLEKKGQHGPLQLQFKALSHMAEITAAMKDRPPGATGIGIDMWGNPGWVVPQRDGSTELFYVTLPADLQAKIKSTVKFSDSIQNKAAAIAAPDESIDELLTKYVAYLGDLVDAAHREFGHK